jgi:diacylglycerol O-acyltransferase / wax synthase
LPARFRAIHASSEAAKAVVKELKPVLGVDIPITGSPWLLTGLASLLGRSNLVSRLPAAGNVAISNVPGPPMTLYMAGAKMVHYFPVSIPYHGSALNITVQSYAGLLEFGLTACRRILSQDESYEMIEHLRTALREIEALPPVEAVATVGPAASAPNEPAKASTKKESVAVAPPVVVPQELAVAKEVASSQSGSGLKPPLGLAQSPRRSRRRMPHTGD